MLGFIPLGTSPIASNVTDVSPDVVVSIASGLQATTSIEPVTTSADAQFFTVGFIITTNIGPNGAGSGVTVSIGSSVTLGSLEATTGIDPVTVSAGSSVTLSSLEATTGIDPVTVSIDVPVTLSSFEIETFLGVPFYPLETFLLQTTVGSGTIIAAGSSVSVIPAGFEIVSTVDSGTVIKNSINVSVSGIEVTMGIDPVVVIGTADVSVGSIQIAGQVGTLEPIRTGSVVTLTGVQATTFVGLVNIWGIIDPNLIPDYTPIIPNQGATWTDITPAAGTSFNNVAPNAGTVYNEIVPTPGTIWTKKVA
tara:strand:+ start:1036 stop:1956 length:921 start_codon:yes stop_codon:yes gene_type:complete